MCGKEKATVPVCLSAKPSRCSGWEWTGRFGSEAAQALGTEVSVQRTGAAAGIGVGSGKEEKEQSGSSRELEFSFGVRPLGIQTPLGHLQSTG